MNTLARENHDGDRKQTEQFAVPSASVIEAADGYTLEIEVTIVGRRHLPTVEGALIHHESRAENFRRAFEFDPSVNADKISAKIDQGLVTLTVPKAEHVKPRKIV